MKVIKAIGVMLLFGAGYATHILVTSAWALQGKIYVGIIIALMVHIGTASVIAKNDTSFKKSFAEALAWPFNLFP